MSSRHPQPADDGNMVDLGYYGRVLRDHKGLLVLGLVLGALLGLLAARLLGPSYSSSADVVVQPIGVSDTVGTLNTDGGVNIETQQQLAGSAAVAERVQENLETEESVPQLLGGLGVTVPTRSSVLSFTYTASDARTAQERAQGFAEAYLETRRDAGTRTVNDLTLRVQERITEVGAALEQARADLAAADPDSAEASDAQVRQDVLTSQISNLQTRLAELSTLVVEPGSVIQPAPLPPPAGGLTRALVVTSFALLGLLLAAMAAFLRARLDQRVRRAEDVERALDLPVLATLGAAATGRGRSQDVSLQVLAARLLVTARTTPGRTIALASPEEPPAGSGADVATRLATAMSEQGVPVALVAAHAPGSVARPAGSRLQLVQLAQPDGSLGGPDRIHSLLDEARATASAVVVSAPATLTSPTTFLLAAESDAVVLVAHAGSTRMDDLLESASFLEEMGSSIIGVVLDAPAGKQRGRRTARAPEVQRSTSASVAPEPADAR